MNTLYPNNPQWVNTILQSIKLLILLTMISYTIQPMAETNNSSNISGSNNWSARGPNQIQGAQVEGITNNPVVGAINSIAVHPSDADTIYIGAVNGGLWKTTNATSSNPNWLPLTDNNSSLSIGDIVFDKSDITNQTLIYGNGRSSSFGRRGGARSGLFRTTNGGSNWTALDSSLIGKNISKIEARGNIILAAVDSADSFTCSNIGIYRSTDSGTTFTKITNGISSGSIDSLVGDPSDNTIFYANVRTYATCGTQIDGVFKSIDSGATWNKVSNTEMDNLSGSNYEISVGNNNNVFVGIVTSGRLSGVFYSSNGGTSWTTMDLPTTFEDNGNVGIHPGGQGSIHFSLVADLTSSTIVYVGGDRQTRTFSDTGSFPNSIGAQNFTGRLFRGDASLTPGSQWTPLTHNGTNSNSSPHADSRDMAIDFNNNLIESDDGGIYRRTNPSTTTGDWFSVNGDLSVTEIHDASLDTLNNIIIGGNQDNGSSQEITTASPIWESVNQGDGGDTATRKQNANTVFRMSSAQTLFGFRVETYNENNQLTAVNFPSRTVISGDPFVAQFSTPIYINEVDPLRVLFGGSNGLYESSDQGSSLNEIAAGVSVLGFSRNNIVYGASDNSDIIYVGACQQECNNPSDGDDGIFVRTTTNGNLNFVHSVGASQGMTGDSQNSNTAVYIDSNTINMTNNTGSTWSDISGNIQSLNPGTFRSIKYLNHVDGNGIALGTDNGIYLTKAADNFVVWSELGSNLPNAPVYDIDYDSSTDQIMVATLGRGSYVLTNILSTPPNPDVIYKNGFEN